MSPPCLRRSFLLARCAFSTGFFPTAVVEWAASAKLAARTRAWRAVPWRFALRACCGSRHLCSWRYVRHTSCSLCLSLPTSLQPASLVAAVRGGFCRQEHLFAWAVPVHLLCHPRLYALYLLLPPLLYTACPLYFPLPSTYLFFAALSAYGAVTAFHHKLSMHFTASGLLPTDYTFTARGHCGTTARASASR